MEQQDKPDPRKAKILPVVRYSVTRKAERSPTIGTMRPCSSLRCSPMIARRGEDKLSDATGIECEAWKLESTKRNLGLIRKERAARNQDAAWINDLEGELQRASDAIKPAANNRPKYNRRNQRVGRVRRNTHRRSPANENLLSKTKAAGLSSGRLDEAPMRRLAKTEV